MNSCEYIVIHHTAYAPKVPQFDLVNGWHKQRGFPKSSLGFYVGYHYFIGFDGTVKVARRETEIGAHCAADGMNYKGIGICLAGDFTWGRRPTPEQIKALALLVKDVKARHQIPDSNVLKHGEVKNTECPGDSWDFRAELQKFWETTDGNDSLKQHFQDFEREYAEATSTAKRNRFRRILDRIRRVAAERGVVLGSEHDA